MAPHNEQSDSSALSPELVNSAILSQLEIEQRLERERLQQRLQQSHSHTDAGVKSPASTRTARTMLDIDALSESQPSLSLPIPEEVLREQQRLLDQSSQQHQARRSSSRNTHTPSSNSRRSQPQSSGSIEPEPLLPLQSRRQQSRQEWQSKREALQPSQPAISPVARRAPQGPGDQQWDDAEAKRQTRVPAVAQALAAQGNSSRGTSATNNRPASLSRASSRSNGPPNLEEVDVDSLVIERAAPPLHHQRSLRKTSSAASYNNSVSSNIGGGGGGQDYIVEPNPLVGAFHVVAPMEERDRAPPSVIDPTPSISESQSTITPQTFFSDEQHSRWNGNGNSNTCAAAQVPTSLSLPATLVGSTINAPVARIRLVAASGDENNDGNDMENGANGSQLEETSPMEQKSTITYILGGLVIFVVAAGGIFLLLDRFHNWVGFYDENELPFGGSPAPTSSAAPSVAPTTPSPTFMPTPNVADVVNLPQYSMDAIYQQPDSAQRKAFHWLLEDIESNPSQPEWKLQQRYALATLFYASNNQNVEGSRGTCDVNDEGISWQKNVGTWLNHSLDECQWQADFAPDPYRICAFDGQPIEALLLARNCLIGYLPPEISILTDLRYVDLDVNHLRQTAMAIPTEIGLLSQLETFKFYQNKAVGFIPSEIGLLTRLKEFDVSQNRLQEHVPTELGLLHGLEVLLLRENQLSGTFPSESWDLLRHSLMQLDVDRNNLMGSLPKEVINDALRYREATDPEGYNDFSISLARNNFSGTIPSKICECFDSRKNQLIFDCDPEGLCGCDRCGECPA